MKSTPNHFTRALVGDGRPDVIVCDGTTPKVGDRVPVWNNTSNREVTMTVISVAPDERLYGEWRCGVTSAEMVPQPTEVPLDATSINPAPENKDLSVHDIPVEIRDNERLRIRARHLINWFYQCVVEHHDWDQAEQVGEVFEKYLCNPEVQRWWKIQPQRLQEFWHINWPRCRRTVFLPPLSPPQASWIKDVKPILVPEGK